MFGIRKNNVELTNELSEEIMSMYKDLKWINYEININNKLSNGEFIFSDEGIQRMFEYDELIYKINKSINKLSRRNKKLIKYRMSIYANTFTLMTRLITEKAYDIMSKTTNIAERFNLFNEVMNNYNEEQKLIDDIAKTL